MRGKHVLILDLNILYLKYQELNQTQKSSRKLKEKMIDDTLQDSGDQALFPLLSGMSPQAICSISNNNGYNDESNRTLIICQIIFQRIIVNYHSHMMEYEKLRHTKLSQLHI